MLARRHLLKLLGSLPFVGLGSHQIIRATENPATADAISRDFFKELGVRTFINAAGTYTSMTGSLMPQEVVEAIQFGTTQYVDLDELQDKVGLRIAQLLDCEDATVTSGCFGAMSIAMAGLMTGMDPQKVSQLPNTKGMPDQVIIQKSHDIGYKQALTNVGAKVIFVETAEQLQKAISKKTALLWFLNAHTHLGEIKYQEWVDLGKQYHVPTLIDCAADVPPVENLFKFQKMGFDLVTFSGGKGLRGPQSAGLLYGKKKYIQAARLHTPPRGQTIGRGMKVNKEEILGMLVALELYLKTDHQSQWKFWEYQIELIKKNALSVSGVEAQVHVPPHANHVPSLKLFWDQSKVAITPNEFREKLRLGHPSIATVGNTEHVGITTWMMAPGQERIVARRIQELFRQFAI
ncbi:MAG: aminotransferase class V-fold PLP-dependent enzyme [Flavobacteriaceae bacterium]|nr:aminotransferase class V-fold PLP-dependent enzyme [Flavobacteriaceae bacterium]MCY4215388.1 aminotransferase class V-fold PLP-dependent enzyme [Flavobacteriaceae bacterium]MCY4267997.1 aminotransferase class V-fold PLP-dependent enzyme [Flavobacteriaceae bacterium]MCY4298884.1 aminotransferase class V-fold PLP-dependent enzyme [Flavobacteriaceae bacterium]